MESTIGVAVEILKTLGSLASMVSAAIALRRERREIGEPERAMILRAGDVAAQPPPAVEAITVVARVQQDILDASNKRIDKAIKRYSKAIANPTSTQSDIDRETEIAESDICYFLGIIRRHNSGQLPGNDYEEKWKDFNCDQFQD